MTDTSGPAPRIQLGDEVPQDIRDFVACRADTVVLDLANADWLPNTPLGRPTIDYEPGSEPNRGTLTLGLEWAPSTSIGVAIVDGKLELDLGLTPDILAEPITRWVDALNAQLADNGKELGSTSFADGRLTATKQAIGAGEEAEDEVAPAAPVVGGAVGQPPHVEPTPTEGEPGEDEDKGGLGCTSWILIAGAAALVALIGGFLATRDGDDETASDDQEVEVGVADDGGDEAGPSDADDDEKIVVTGSAMTVAELCTQAPQPAPEAAATTGQDPRLSLQGVVPVVEEDGTGALVLCFEQPWAIGAPYDLFSMMFDIEIAPATSADVWWTVWTWHDGKGEAQAGDPDGEAVPEVSLLPGGYPLVTWDGFRPDDGLEYQVWYRTGSWVSDDPKAAFEEFTFPTNSATWPRLEGDWPPSTADISTPGQ